MSGRGWLYKGDWERAAGPGGRGSLCPCAHVSPEVLGALAPLTPAWHPAGPPGRRTCCRCRPGCSRCSSTPQPSWGVTETGQGSAWDGDTAQLPLPHGTALLPQCHSLLASCPQCSLSKTGPRPPTCQGPPAHAAVARCPSVSPPQRGSNQGPLMFPSTIPLPPWCHSLESQLSVLTPSPGPTAPLHPLTLPPDCPPA